MADAPAATQVVDPQRRRVALHQRLGRDAVATEEGDEEGERSHEERCVLEQSLALAQVLIDEAELSLLQIAQTAVDHLGGLRTRARGDVAAVDERDASVRATPRRARRPRPSCRRR